MAALTERLEKFNGRLAEWTDRYRVPGASVAVCHRGETYETAVGVVNMATGVEATPDAVFQIGSITKLFTALLVMREVEAGRLALDAPVRRYLPDIRFGDTRASAEITVAHLLSHASGLDGDFFYDVGGGDASVERYVLACSALPQLHPPGDGFSYCNVGFVVAGRLIEVVRGTTWPRAFIDLARSMGADTLECQAERLLFHRAAIGHIPDPESGQPALPPSAFLAPSNAPAGATPYGAARDLLALARLVLAEGRAPDGTAIVEPATLAAMFEPHNRPPEGQICDHFGLGFMNWDWAGRRLVGHDGGTIGQSSYLRIVPDADLAIALLTNGGVTAALYRRVFGELLAELADITLPPLPVPTDDSFDPARYAGTYERLAARAEVEARGSQLWVLLTDRDPLFPAPKTKSVQLLPVGPDRFCMTAEGSRFRSYVDFVGRDDQGRACYYHTGRALPRVGGGKEIR